MTGTWYGTGAVRPALASLAAFLVLAVAVSLRLLGGLDRAFATAVQSAQDCSLWRVGLDSSVLFSIEVSVVFALLATAVLWRAGYGWPWSLVAWLVFLSLATELTLKLFGNQPSPVQYPWPREVCGDERYPLPLSFGSPNSFPSGFSIRMAYFTVLAIGLLAAHHYPRLAVATGAASAALYAWFAWSRVYIAWHWPADVLGGILLGAALAFFSLWLLAARPRSIQAVWDRLLARRSQLSRPPG